ncbi:MAG TPA: hypothetical protein VFW98_08265 [Gemmatimonadaceae bacterium]|nr:hypothetical protein [Gemmatimonadaceae bacterium]
MATPITETDLLAALAAAFDGDGDGQTVADLSASTGLSQRIVRDALRAAQRQGRLRVHRVRRPALDGRMMLVPAYTIAPASASAPSAASRRRRS